MSVETWSLQHPEYGLIEVRAGFDNEFADLDPSWPGELPEKFADNPESIAHVPAYGTTQERLQALQSKPPTRLQVVVDGQVQHQYESVESGRIPLFGPGPKEKLDTFISLGVDRAKPHLRLYVNTFKELLRVEFREGATVVEFDPPAGSRGEKRRNSLESSPAKRALVPIAEGLGKGGWALAVLLLGPLVGRFLDWLSQFLPDINMPDITLPQVDLPIPALPQVELPTLDIPWPDMPDLPDMPYWVAWLLQYSKIWIPVVFGIIFGIVALRNKSKSDTEKAKWEQAEADSHPAQAEPGLERN